LEPTWEKLAHHFQKSDVFIGRVDCTVDSDICTRYGIQGYPTLYYLTPGNKMIKFDGMRSFDILTSFAQDGYKTKPATDRPKPGNASLFSMILSNPIYIVLIMIIAFVIILTLVGLCLCFCDMGDAPAPPRKPRPSALLSEAENVPNTSEEVETSELVEKPAKEKKQE
jgi:hypothetical protein